MRLITNDSNNLAFYFCESNDDVFGVVRHDFEEFVSISYIPDDLEHVISFVRVFGHNIVQDIASCLVSRIDVGPRFIRTLMVATLGEVAQKFSSS